MNSKIIFVAAVIAVAAADRRPFSYSAPQFSSEEFGPAHYDFDWAVRHSDSGNNFGHQEARDGDNTQGTYFVHLPDGRLQTVRFVVDGDSGFLPQISYDGEARYPDSFESRSFESFESREYGRPRPLYG